MATIIFPIGAVLLPNGTQDFEAMNITVTVKSTSTGRVMAAFIDSMSQVTLTGGIMTADLTVKVITWNNGATEETLTVPGEILITGLPSTGTLGTAPTIGDPVSFTVDADKNVTITQTISGFTVIGFPVRSTSEIWLTGITYTEVAAI